MSILNTTVRTSIVRHALQEVDLESSKKQNIPLPTTRSVHCRLEFVECHQAWTIHEWYRVILGDETKIKRF